MEDEAQLMRRCGHLYASIALESLGTTLMAVFFAYLLLLITNKGRLQNPLTAAWTFLRSQLSAFVREVSDEVTKWPEMPRLPLDKRFAMCRKTNQAICSFQILIGILSIERWLHINNVNGFRYLGYSITCPPMQSQLIVLIAPVVPCYYLQCVVTYFLTTLMLLLGYASSVMEGELYLGDITEFWGSWDLDQLQVTNRFWVLAPSVAIQVYLSFIQIPYLFFIYCVKGGVRAGLPYGYRKLLLVVAVTWLTFPVWWCLSYEGMSIITDTKLNGVGFCLLNVISKGSFTMQMLSMTRWHRRERKRQECLENGRRLTNSQNPTLFGEDADAEGEDQVTRRRTDRRNETWVVKMLRPYDEEALATPQNWQALEPTYRAFLVGHSVTPKSWDTMGSEQRAVLKEHYESTFNLVVGEGAEGLDEGAASQRLSANKREVQAAPAGRKKLQAPIEEDEEEDEEDEDDKEDKEDKEYKEDEEDEEDGKDEDDEDVKDEEDEDEEDDEEEDIEEADEEQDRPAKSAGGSTGSNIRVGQTVTTVNGVKGRVLRMLGKEVQVAVPGKRAQVVNMEDLTMLKVIFLGARGLHHVDKSGKKQLFCSCLLDGRPSSEARTPAAVRGAKAAWEQEVEVLGYSHGDSLALRLWGRDARTGADHLLGEAKLQGGELLDGGFEGELQLCEDGKRLPAYLSAVVVGIGLPPEPGSPAHSEEFGDFGFGMPMVKPAKPKVLKDNRQTPDGRLICCF